MKAFIAIILSVFVVGCANKNDTTSTNSGYYSNNGFCFMSSTGQQVDNSYCSTNTTSQGQCVGVYIYNGQYVQCAGSNCRGYTLIQATTGTAVLCQ